MSNLITLCRGVGEEAYEDCFDDHEGSEVTLAAPCKVEAVPCVRTAAAEHVGPEAESSAIFLDAMAANDCCDC